MSWRRFLALLQGLPESALFSALIARREKTSTPAHQVLSDPREIAQAMKRSRR